MTMVIFFHSPVESCGSDQRVSSREEVCPSSPKVVAYLLEKKRHAFPTPKQKRKVTMVIFLPSAIESCEGGHGLCHHLLEKRGCRSSPKEERVLTMVMCFLFSVENCGGDHGISSREKGVGPSNSKRERSMSMAIFLPSLKKS